MSKLQTRNQEQLKAQSSDWINPEVAQLPIQAPRIGLCGFITDLMKRFDTNHRDQAYESQNPQKPEIVVPKEPQVSDHRVYFTCEICCVDYEDVQTNKWSLSQSCSHPICKSCLLDYTALKINSFAIVNCPAQNCPHQLSVQGEFFLNEVDPVHRTRYKKVLLFLEVSKYPNRRLCPMQNCNQGVIQLGRQQSKSAPVVCEACKSQFCSKCFNPKHEGNCEKYHRQAYQHDFNFMKCRECKMLVERAQGCDHISCRCGYQFCYKCGCTWSSEHSKICWEKKIAGITKLNFFVKIPIKFLFLIAELLLFVILVALTLPFVLLVLAGRALRMSYLCVIRKLNRKVFIGILLIVFLPIVFIGFIFNVLCRDLGRAVRTSVRFLKFFIFLIRDTIMF